MLIDRKGLTHYHAVFVVSCLFAVEACGSVVLLHVLRSCTSIALLYILNNSVVHIPDTVRDFHSFCYLQASRDVLHVLEATPLESDCQALSAACLKC